MKKNFLKVFVFPVLLVAFAVTLFACDKKEDTVMHKVTFYNEETVMQVVDVEDGQKVARPTELETKEGYTFVNWFATQSKNHIFDFDMTITEDKSVYAGFSKYVADTREWYVVGSGQSPLLSASNWGKNIGDAFTMEKSDSNKNVFTITMDVIAGDEFQFAGLDWIHKRGYGYVKEVEKDGTKYFEGQGGGYGDVASKGQNIKALVSGNYTFTLTTYPNDDTYDTSNPSYAESSKEIFNVGTYDTIEWKRNKDAEPLPTSVINWYIKGQNITSWTDCHISYTRFTKVASDYTLTVYLTDKDQVMFNSFSMDLETSKEGNQVAYINGGSGTRSAQFDELFALSGNNFTPKKTGMYTIKINAGGATPSIDATLEEKAPELLTHDFYVNGTFTDPAWSAVSDKAINAQYKFSHEEGSYEYKFEGLALKESDEIVVQSMTSGATAGAGNWGTKFDYNNLILPNENCTQASEKNLNIKIVNAGIYDITFNIYSRTIKIAQKGNDIWIKGAFDACGNGTNWAHEFADGLKLTEVAGHAGVYMLEFTVANTQGGDLSFGLDMYDLGSTANGIFVGRAALGTEGVSAQCDPGSGNAKFPEAGTYWVVYDTVNKVLNVYTSNPF